MSFKAAYKYPVYAGEIVNGTATTNRVQDNIHYCQAFKAIKVVIRLV